MKIGNTTIKPGSIVEKIVGTYSGYAKSHEEAKTHPAWEPDDRLKAKAKDALKFFQEYKV